jgi:drug/metabolite transporter (DMT)-like permease
MERGRGALRVAGLAGFALVAFAANSILARLALRGLAIDAASYSAVRLASGAVMLGLLARAGAPADTAPRAGGDWLSALALFAYAVPFAFAYLELPAGTGALLLFGSVQATMILTGLVSGERPGRREWAGLLVAIMGLVYLVAPGIGASPVAASALMAVAGVAWGVYSLRGRRSRAPLRDTAGNFLRSLAFAPMLAIALLPSVRLSDGPPFRFSAPGLALAVASGALASGVGYAAWYAVLPRLTAVRAATVQLATPALTAVAGVALLGEDVTLRLLVSAVAILGGIGLCVYGDRA